MLLESHQERGQRRTIVIIALNEVLPALGIEPGQKMDAAKALDPGAERSLAVFEQKPSVLDPMTLVIAVQGVLDAFRQPLLYLGKLALVLVLSFLLRIFAQPSSCIKASSWL